MEGKYKLQICTRKEIPRLASANQPRGWQTRCKSIDKQEIWVVAKKMERHHVAEKKYVPFEI